MAGEKKYGLIIPSKKGAATKSKITKPSIFGESSDEEDSGIGGSLWRENKKRSKQIESHESVTKALAEDPTIFEYDSLYDEMQEKKKKSDPRLQKKDTKPKYINQLKKMAEKRKLEQEIIYERKVQREMEEEGGEFKDKDTFLTSAYRKKLEERRKMEEELRREDAIEAANDVKKQKDLSKFHRNLLNRIAPSGHPSKESEDSNATSTDKEQNRGKERHSSAAGERMRDRERRPSDERTRDRQRRPSDERTRDRQRRSSDEFATHRRGHREEQRAHRDRRNSDRSPEQRTSRRSPPPKPIQRSTSERERSPETEKSEEKMAEERTSSDAPEDEQKMDEGAEVKPAVRMPTKEDLEEKRRVVAAKRTNTEAMESAKERYLARKRAKLSVPVVVQDD